MKKLIVIAVIALGLLVPASASALTQYDAHRYAAKAMNIEFGGAWKYGYDKHLTVKRRMNARRVRFEYEFNHSHFGYVTIWTRYHSPYFYYSFYKIY